MYGATDSNIFQVQNPDVFIEEFSQYDPNIVINEYEDRFMSMYMDHKPWPTEVMFRGKKVEVDFIDLIAPHLTENSYAVLFEVQHEDEVYGDAIAINANGEKVRLALTDIYDIAKKQFGIK